MDYTPAFREAIAAELKDRRNKKNEAHRHEISSLLFLPLFPEAEWPVLIDMIVAHHKSVQQDRSMRGLLDLADDFLGPDRTFERHAHPWATWSEGALTLMNEFDIETTPVSQEEARYAFDFAVEYCRNRPPGRSRWRGLLMGADRFASCMQYDAEEKAEQLFETPNLSFYERSSPKTDDGIPIYPLAEVNARDERPHTLVQAPTGAGKTDFLLRRCRGRVFYTLPFQASINAMYRRIREDLNEADTSADVRRLHAASRIEMDDLPDELEPEDAALQEFPGASVKVMTPHQMASVVFGMSGHEVTALDIAGQDVILDEVHVYNGPSQAMVVEIVKTLAHLGCRVHIGTATIPDALADLLTEVLGGEENVYPVALEENVLDSFDRHIVHKLDDEDAARARVREAVQNGGRVLFISNRVSRAQERFQWAWNEFGEAQTMLIHSRFRRKDRAELEDDIDTFEKQDGPCVVCATQVVEVSLDISFDCMVTDAAPLDNLVQRFGRVNRRRNARTIGTHKPVCVVEPPEEDKAILPYDAETVRKSFALLPDNAVLKESALRKRISEVYPEVDLSPIESHLAVEDGEMLLPELWHQPSSVLMDVLEFDSVACILRSDVDAYLNGYTETRMKLEIPVPWSTAWRFKKEPQLERGNYPFVIEDRHYDPEGVPLGLAYSEKAASPEEFMI
jgi:CRISPR-associated endonuclease/helicase Cas3